MINKGTHNRCRSSALGKLVTGAVVILLLCIPGGVSLATASVGDDSGSPPIAQVLESPFASNGSSWFRIRANLSNNPTYYSGYPDIASDGDYVAVVWTEGYEASAGAKHHGQVYMRWISESGGGWSGKVTVDNGTNTDSDWATDAAVVLQGSTAHVVWVRCENITVFSVLYRACTLGGSCGPVTTLANPTANVRSSPDIATDAGGKLFVVWTHEAGSYRAIYYREFNGSAWGSAEEISENNTVNDWPVVSVSNNIAYTAWVKTIEIIEPPSEEGKVMYRRKTAGGSWLDAVESLYTVSSSRYPHLMANASTVYAGWETYVSASEQYQVNYKYHNGTAWQPSEANDKKTITSTTSLYDISTSGDEYLQYLQPALTLDDQGNLYAVWHEKYEAGEGDTIHRVLYSRSNNPTAETPSWEDEKVFATLSADEQAFSADNVSARIAVSGTWAEPHVHVVLMLDSGSAWDVWYLSNQTYSSVLLPIILRNP